MAGNDRPVPRATGRDTNGRPGSRCRAPPDAPATGASVRCVDAESCAAQHVRRRSRRIRRTSISVSALGSRASSTTTRSSPRRACDVVAVERRERRARRAPVRPASHPGGWRRHRLVDLRDPPLLEQRLVRAARRGAGREHHQAGGRAVESMDRRQVRVVEAESATGRARTRAGTARPGWSGGSAACRSRRGRRRRAGSPRGTAPVPPPAGRGSTRRTGAHPASCPTTDRTAVGAHDLAGVEPPVQVVGVQVVEPRDDVLGDRRPRPGSRDAQPRRSDPVLDG